MKAIRYEPEPGASIKHSCRVTRQMAKQQKCLVRFNFNAVPLIATPKKSVVTLEWEYDTIAGMRSNAYRNSKEGIRKRREAEAFRKRADAAIAEGIRTFSLKEPELWASLVEKNQNRNDFGFGIIRFAAHWANLMEAKMVQGAKLEDIADKTSHMADVDGITGYMYGHAVSVLSQVWKYGKQLQRWHNLNVQIGNEGEETNKKGGTLNQAIVKFC